MASFPRSEAEIIALAQSITAGLTANAATYPAPPVLPVDLQTLVDSFNTLSDDAVAARAASEQATGTKEAGLEEVVNAMNSILRYAENTVDFDDDQLKLLGWAGRHARTPLDPPGQPRTLEAPQQGDDWVFLDWKKPTDGGTLAAYKIERREMPAGAWQEVKTVFESEATLTGQERGKQWEYRVIAANKAGDGPVSNTVAVVL